MSNRSIERICCKFCRILYKCIRNDGNGTGPQVRQGQEVNSKFKVIRAPL
ncbi:MAG: hypothetical protein ACR2F1_07255 [Nitrososphaeraceae archaeon]